jgi:endo-1,4-beta-xylanase
VHSFSKFLFAFASLSIASCGTENGGVDNGGGAGMLGAGTGGTSGTAGVTTSGGAGATAGSAGSSGSGGSMGGAAAASGTSGNGGSAGVLLAGAGGQSGDTASGGNAGSVATGGAGGAAGTPSSGGMAGASGDGGGAGVSGQAGAAGGAGMPACGNPQTLKEAGDCTGRPVGVALSIRYLDDPEYAERALHFNYVTPEDEMKWDVTEPQRGVFTFEQGDQIVEFAEANDMAVKGHTLLWHNQLPTWLTNLNNENDVRDAMLGHIEGVMDHYAGRVIAWDVVNEAFNDDATRRDSVFQRYLGDSYIEEAFIAARAADPTVKLYYNDYDIESAYDKADAVYEMVADFVARDIPIDGVGMQMHTRTRDEDPPIPEFVFNLERILALGLEVVISEMDVRLCDDGTFEKQAERYHDIVAECIARPGCTAVTVWGITDQYSFLNARTDLVCQGAEPPRPLLWDDDYNAKPAYDALLQALAGR